MFSFCLLSLATCVLVSVAVSASPEASIPAHQTINLVRKAFVSRSRSDIEAWAENEREALRRKYGISQGRKRDQGSNLLLNADGDNSYVGSIAVGTPPQTFNVIMDTGSADFWLAGTECSPRSCSTVPRFDALRSSTFQQLPEQFQVVYGTGSASGIQAQDTVQLAGFQVLQQAFGVCNFVDRIVSNETSGLLGLGWQAIATSQSTPFWELARTKFNSPVMSFQLTRFINVSGIDSVYTPGGTFTMGFVNSSLFTGQIDFQPLVFFPIPGIPPNTPTYWTIALTNLAVGSRQVPLSTSVAAIDTGTTLVGGPPADIAAFYAAIPGSAPQTGRLLNFYSYPCSPAITVSMRFGGRTWKISPSDFEIARLSVSTCLGAFFALDTNSSSPDWIVGDAFLKNVYSVFRAEPPSVGFADLSSLALSMNGVVSSGTPTATVGTPVATATATGRGTGRGTASSSTSSDIRLNIAFTFCLIMAVVWSVGVSII